MPRLKKEIEDHQSSFRHLRADTDKLSTDPREAFPDVFSMGFMKKYTTYNSIENFLDSSPADVNQPHSFETDEFKQFVSRNSVFDNWDEMVSKASEEWIVSEIDL